MGTASLSSLRQTTATKCAPHHPAMPCHCHAVQLAATWVQRGRGCDAVLQEATMALSYVFQACLTWKHKLQGRHTGRIAVLAMRVCWVLFRRSIPVCVQGQQGRAHTLQGRGHGAQLHHVPGVAAPQRAAHGLRVQLHGRLVRHGRVSGRVAGGGVRRALSVQYAAGSATDFVGGFCWAQAGPVGQ